MFNKDIYEKDWESCTPVALLYNPGNRLKRRNILKFLPTFSKAKILDIGCGSGDIQHDIMAMYQEKIKCYVSFDISKNALKLSRELSKDCKYPFFGICGDAQYLPFKEEEFQIIICSEVLEHVPRDDIVMKEINRVLKNDGAIIITIPYLEKDLNKLHLRRYDLKTFINLIDSTGFKIERIAFPTRSMTMIRQVLKKIAGRQHMGKSEIRYYNSSLHKKIVMPMMDKIFLLDNLFAKNPHSLIGDSGTLLALLRKKIKIWNK